MNHCSEAFPLISIIVPIYNAQAYLERCLLSLKNQTYENIEVLLINDGSKDNSGKIAEDFAKSDIRFKVFHLENGGVSAARNYGLKQYTGAYVTFVDSDDYVDIHYLEFLYKAIVDTECKMAVCQNYTTDECAQVYVETDLTINPKVINVDENYDYTADYARCSVWSTLFQREIIGEHLFSEDIYIGEDTLFVAQAMNVAKKYAMIDQKLYIYILYQASSSHGTYAEKHRTEIRALQRVKEVYDIKHPKFVSNLNARYCFSCINAMKLMSLYMVDDDEWYRFLHAESKKNIVPFLKSQYASSRKIIALLFCLFPRMIKNVYKIAKKIRG